MSIQLGEISTLRKELRQGEIDRGEKQFEAVRNVIVSMTNGVDVSSLFPQMLKVRLQ